MAAELQLFCCRLGLALLAAQDKVRSCLTVILLEQLSECNAQEVQNNSSLGIVTIPKVIRTDLLTSLQQLKERSRSSSGSQNISP